MNIEVKAKLKNQVTGEYIESTYVEVEKDEPCSINTEKDCLSDPEDDDSDHLYIGDEDWTAYISFDSDELISFGLASDTKFEVRSDDYNPCNYIDDSGYELHRHPDWLPDHIDLYVKVNTNSDEDSDW